MGVHEAKTQLSRLLRLVDAGSEVEILRNGEAAARIVAPAGRGERTFALNRNAYDVPADFDAPLPLEVLAGFTG